MKTKDDVRGRLILDASMRSGVHRMAGPTWDDLIKQKLITQSLRQDCESLLLANISFRR
jgi:hypothetical protein